MKLATLNDGSRDGQLLVVSRDLSTAHVADAIAPTLQRALDDWDFIAPQLEDLALELNQGRSSRAFQFDPRRCMAPLPRAYQLVRVSAGATRPGSQVGDGGVPGQLASPSGLRIWQGRSDAFGGPFDDALFGSEDWRIDLEAAIAAVLDDVAIGASAEQCGGRIRLLMLASDWCLRAPPHGADYDADAIVHRRPATTFCPIAVTPDELGEAWRDTRVQLPTLVHWNGMRLGVNPPADAAPIGFAGAIVELARTRSLRAGSIIAIDAASPAGDAPFGPGLAARRARETGASGEPPADFVRFGDRLRIEMIDAQGMSVFGAIDQSATRSPA